MNSEDNLEVKKESFVINRKRILYAVIYTIVLLILGGLVYLSWKAFMKRFLSDINRVFEMFAQQNSLESYSFFISVQLLFSWVPIPGYTYFIVLMSFFMHDFLKSSLIAGLGSYAGGLLSYFMVKYCLRSTILRIYQNSIVYKIFLEEVKRSPWSISFFSNLLLLPHAVKNILLPLTEMTFLQFAIPKIPNYLIYTVLSCMIGNSLHSFKDFSRNKRFTNMTFAEQLDFCFAIIAVIVTIAILIYIGVISRRKFKEYKDREALLEHEKIPNFCDPEIKTIGFLEDNC